ncbi:MAG: hypothetical protein IT369_13430 [Candidatus Latescibacteria bacterium]|nr:hypothetical protein [Candidatus Latescibacterota bacterium]
MSEQISPTTASLSAQALTLVSREIRTRQDTAERAQTDNRRSAAPKRRAEAEAVQKQQERLSSRVDQLVQSKKAVSTRISSDTTSPPQRTVLVSRANDLQRQVNELDGIVGGEGQGDLSNAAALTAKPQATAASSFRPQATSALKPQTESFSAKAQTTSALRSAPTQQQPTAGALRAFAKNSPTPQAATAKVDLVGMGMANIASSQVDLIA